MLKILLAASSLVLLAGCATDPRDTAWDPKPGHSLLDQIPNWDGEARRRCGGHLRAEERLPGMSDRC